MANVLETGADAIRTVLMAVGGGATFKEGYSYDRLRVDALPGFTMGYLGSAKSDDLGIRSTHHHRIWLHRYKVRLWIRTDPANTVVNETDVRTLTAKVVDAIETEPTLGGLVDASGVLDIDEPFLMQSGTKIVATGVDLTVAVAIKSAKWYT